MKKALLLLFTIGILTSTKGQSLWTWKANLENHFQISKSETKNLESAGNIGNMPRASFSLGEGVGFNLGLERFSDSSNLTWSVNFQRLWGNLVSSGSQRDTNLYQEELVQSRQSNIKIGVGYQNKGKYSYAFQVGPLIPIGGKHFTSIYYESNGNQFSAHYKNEFKSNIGLWFAADYRFQINTKVELFAGAGFQLLQRNISSRTLEDFVQIKGIIDRNSYAPNVYNQDYQFIDDVKADMNDAVINPNGFSLNEARELQTQSFSFSSAYIQMGVKYMLY